MASFGEILRILRIERHLKQSDLAMDGMSSATISQYESNKRSPSYETMQALAKKLDVSVSVFFPGCQSEENQRVLMTLFNQAELAERRHHVQEALDCWESAYIVCRSQHFRNYEFTILQHKGMMLAELGNWQESIDMLLRLIVRSEFTQDFENSYHILWLLGKCSRELGQWELANTFAQLATEIVSPTDDRWIRMQINLGTGYCNIGNWDKAKDSYKSAIQNAKISGNGLLEAWALTGLASTLLNQGQIEFVESYLARAHHLATLLEEGALAQSIQHNYVVYHRVAGQWQLAKSLAKELSLLESLPFNVQAELLHEKLLIAANTKDEELGMEALQSFENIQVSGSMRGLLWLGATEYYIAMRQDELAARALHHASSLLAISHYHDTSDIVRLTKLIEERRKHSE